MMMMMKRVNGYKRIKRKKISLTMHAKAMYQITCILYYRS